MGGEGHRGPAPRGQLVSSYFLHAKNSYEKKKKKVYHLFHLSMFTERLESCLPIELYFLSVSGAERGTAYYCRSCTFLKEKQEATPGGPHFTGQCDRAGPWRRSDLAMLLDKSWARGHPQSWHEEPSFPIGH